MKILVLTKRQYMGKDLLDDRFGRFRELPLELARLGHDVKGIALSYYHREEGTFSDGDPSAGCGVTWESINLTKEAVPRLRRFINCATHVAMQFEPDLVWAGSDAYHAIFGAWLAKRIRARCVIDLYDNFEAFGASRLPFVLPLFRRAVQEADGVTCVSQRLADYVTRSYLRLKPTTVIGNAVRKDLFGPQDQRTCRLRFGLPENAKIVGTAGALDGSRGIETLFQAFEILSAERSDIHLALAGPRNRKTRIPGGPNVHDLNILSHEEVASFIGALDLCVVCYRESAQGSFSFPQKAYEILACRVRIVAAAVGSMHELFINYPECLYESENPANLASSISRQLDARTTVDVEVPSWADSAKKLEAFLETILKGRSTTKGLKSSRVTG